MKQLKYTIHDELGIHARPAGLLVKAAAGFQCDVKIASAVKEVDAKRIMAVMGLGVKKGDTITVTCSGADEEAAVTAIEAFLTENL